MPCRWYPSMPCRSPGRGGVYPSMPCRFPGPHPVRSLRGLAGGSPDPHPEGCIPACTEADPSPTADGYCCGVHHTGVHSCVHSVHWDMGGWCTKFFACQPFYVLGKVFLNSQEDSIHTKSKPTVQELWLDNQPHGLFKSVHKGCKLQWVNVDYSSVENNKSHAKSCPWVIAQNHFISVLVASNSTRTKKNWFFAASGFACV